MNLYRIISTRYGSHADPLRSERRIELLVLLCALILCLQALYSGSRLLTLSTPAAIAPAEDALSLQSLRARGAVTGQQSAEILSRPLFWEGRRPVDEVVVVAPPGPPAKTKKLSGVKLLGVFGGETGSGVIVRSKDRQQRVLLGETLDGWVLESIDADKVIFSNEGQQQELALKVSVWSPPAPSASEVDSPQGPATDGSATDGSATKKEYTEDDLSLGGSPSK